MKAINLFFLTILILIFAVEKTSQMRTGNKYYKSNFISMESKVFENSTIASAAASAANSTKSDVPSIKQLCAGLGDYLDALNTAFDLLDSLMKNFRDRETQLKKEIKLAKDENTKSELEDELKEDVQNVINKLVQIHSLLEGLVKEKEKFEKNNCKSVTTSKLTTATIQEKEKIFKNYYNELESELISLKMNTENKAFLEIKSTFK
jgi:hypothetical protein